MDNRWNELIYKFWSPMYDKFFNSGQFLSARKEIFQNQIFDKHQKVLLVGVGTGADLEQISYKELNVTAIDYSSDMLKKAREKFKDSSIQFVKMDAQDMNFSDHHFDVVIGSLVVSVVPDAEKCLKEMLRVLKPNGEMIIFDKFAPKNKQLSPLKKAIRPFIKRLGTDIGINFEKLIENHTYTLTVTEDQSIMFNGMYRKILIKKIMS
ncbi:class I SAM-dependent methyltransferase [Pseudalkalibacillus berkeleyi]|uniref:Class I SAM-dependent methyltransferase n=1 Tax=Pseudalkalibacillus berkeleyi TaxID=1069813 RepID=A0ABS9H3P2_9BACL|nr:class I SAM-dependent methyltransferase [Pseudalkalibacillus berkeleyi]MCF6138265.1 class I SAM-dependent methyltransferase [Pseudalkalibacillus berkeleyi]